MTWRALTKPERVLARALGALAVVALVIAALDLAFPPPFNVTVSTVVTDREGRTLRAFPVEDGRWRLRADLDRLDPNFIRALITIEDRRFPVHVGVDPIAVMRAAATSARAGRVVSGASTITMQTARLLEPRPRNLGSKFVEAVRALQLERRLSKTEILELYLTLTPYGGNLEGVRAASWAYFQREPEHLTPEQIALLIALPQAPEARRPDRRAAAAIASRNAVLDVLADAGALSVARAQEAKMTGAPHRSAFPAAAWHASEEVRRQAPGAAEIRSTLDAGLQAELEILARRVALAEGEDVQVSILVIDIPTRAVRAAVGSAGRDVAGGWIDLTNRSRSPGSTLKPLIYGLAFDDGLATPATRIEDLPRRFASYQPDNFDRRFRGEVTIAQALQHSLNVPAVHVLDAVGAGRFAAALSFAGTSPRWSTSASEGVGLALALGGVGLTARDVALLYAALGDEGRARPLVWREDAIVNADEQGEGFTLLSAQSAHDVLNILQGAPAPAGRIPAALTQGAPQIAFKTGTSYGFRDAWAAGVANGVAAVVWVGRADGAPRPGVTGRAGALPVLFDVFDQAAVLDSADVGLRPATPLNAPEAPASLRTFERRAEPPVILFPPADVQVWAERFGPDARPFVLAGRGEGRLRWYVDGAPVRRDAGGAPIWTPDAPGFYAVTAVDAAGRSSRVDVRVIGPAG